LNSQNERKTGRRDGDPFFLFSQRNSYRKESELISFNLGRLVMTRGVNDQVAENEAFAKFVMSSLTRHRRGDWGNLSDEDKQENELSLL